MRNIWKLFFPLALLALLIVTATGQVMAQNPSNYQFFITKVNSSSFPDVSITIRAVDSKGNALDNLAANQLRIFENDNQVPASSIAIGKSDLGPVAVAFLIDMGKKSNGNLSTTRLVLLLNYYKDHYFQDGVDTVAIYARTGDDSGKDRNSTILPPTHSKAELKKIIDNKLKMGKSTVPSSVLSGVEPVVDEMTQFLDGQAGRASTALVVISPMNETATPDTKQLGDTVQQKNVYGYVIYTSNLKINKAPFAEFAELTGGRVVDLVGDQPRLENINPMFDEIYARSKVINLMYRSNYGFSGNRNVSVVNPDQLSTDAADRFPYLMELGAPKIEIISPKSGEQPNNIDAITVRVDLTGWTDRPDQKGSNITRRLAQAELFVDGDLKVSLPNADSQVELTSPIQFSLPISGWAGGTNHVIDVKVTDELGLTASSEPLNIFIAQTVMAPTATNIPKPDCKANPRAPGCPKPTNSTGTIILIIVFALVGVGAGVLILLVLLKKGKKGVSPAPQAAPKAVEGYDEMKTMIYGVRQNPEPDGTTLLAKVHVLVAGKGLQPNEVFNIYSQTTSFGRDPKKCDHQLYDVSERSTVSGLHCTISYQYGKFLLTDEHSQNGTFLNGNPIEPNTPTELKSGDEIILGYLANSGAKMRFEIVENSATPDFQGEGPQETLLSQRAIDSDVTQVGFAAPRAPEPDAGPGLPHADLSQEGDLPSNGIKPSDKKGKDWLKDLS